MTDWKMVKHGERGCGVVELAASERVVRAAFESYTPRDLLAIWWTVNRRESGNEN